ncbi:MAG: chemotaxis protein CheA, partial [Clostridiales bacterium]|nr:chemotaxis protein CheA [Clostridiales bacterium]
MNDPMMEVFIFETSQQIEQLEQSVINSESVKEYSSEFINEIFRLMHTIKSSAAMMLFNNISKVAHSTEDLFYYIRENKPKNVDKSLLCDLVLESVDFVKLELEKIKNGDLADGNEESLINKNKEFLVVLKQSNGETTVVCENTSKKIDKFYISANKSNLRNNKNMFKAIITFKDGCEMENIRAYTIIHNLKDITEEFHHIPEDIIGTDSITDIRKNGFIVYFKTDKTYNNMEQFLSQTTFLEKFNLTQLESDEEYNKKEANNDLSDEVKIPQITDDVADKVEHTSANNQGNSIISVNVEKLDKLMDLVGEMVIAEAMVIQNPDLKGLSLDNFEKSARQLKKITSELQDTVMSIRMVPLGPTLFRMNRIVRDMSKRLKKDVHLDIIGEETEVDKNIIERIGDPLMHIVRNAVDHGIETIEERIDKGKTSSGTLTLEAKNIGGEVLVIIRDDGKGLNKEKILNKAISNGLLHKSPEEMTDKEIFNLIFLPGFSTNDKVTEFSGRGVGMDVVTKNIEMVGGSIQIDSIEERGTTITLKIPLTLAIIDGMNISVGKSRYTIPIMSIKESFRTKEEEVIRDPDGNEMIMIRGQCYPILRLHNYFNVHTQVTNLYEGIIIAIESESKMVCIFADELIGEQQVVVKTLPTYIKNIKKISGISGCTLLGDGNISLILDAN